MSANRYFLLYKPYGMLSQFTREGEHKALCDLEFDFPKDIYPVGRLDHDSEGLLILTNDKRINQLLLDPKHSHWRTYLVQVEGSITSEALQQLQNGVEISINGKKYHTRKCKAKAIESPHLPERIPPIRFRKSVPDSWIELSLTEGKNRQVRRMTAAVGFPTLRLVRFSIEKFNLGTMQPGVVVEIQGSPLYSALRLKA